MTVKTVTQWSALRRVKAAASLKLPSTISLTCSSANSPSTAKMTTRRTKESRRAERHMAGAHHFPNTIVTSSIRQNWPGLDAKLSRVRLLQWHLARRKKKLRPFKTQAIKAEHLESSRLTMQVAPSTTVMPYKSETGRPRVATVAIKRLRHTIGSYRLKTRSQSTLSPRPVKCRTKLSTNPMQAVLTSHFKGMLRSFLTAQMSKISYVSDLTMFCCRGSWAVLTITPKLQRKNQAKRVSLTTILLETLPPKSR